MFSLNLIAEARPALLAAAVFMSLPAAGCSDSSEGGYPPVEVEAGPSICLLTEEDGGIAPVQVTCKVVVGNASESAEGVAVSVEGVMSVNALPEVCADFGPGEQDSKPFGAAVAKALEAAYAKAKSDWTIESVACK